MGKVNFAILDSENNNKYCVCNVNICDIFKEAGTENVIVGFEDEDNLYDFLLSLFMEARPCQFLNCCFDAYYVKFSPCDHELVFDENMEEMILPERIDNIFIKNIASKKE